MSSRPRSPRADRLPRKRTLRPRLEDLEIRLVLSTQEFSASPTYVLFNPPGGAAAASAMPSVGTITGPPTSSMTPSEMRAYYGLNNVMFGSIQGDGTGQTIAIVDAYDDPNMVNSTSPNFANSDLARFDQYFGLPNPPSFTKIGETGSTTTLPGVDPSGGWETEESLDIEWAHVIAPKANILLVEASSQDPFDLAAAEVTAASYQGVSVVSNSWSLPESPYYEAQFTAAFTTPSGHQGVTFLASTGDYGSTGQGGDSPFQGPPADLPNVVAVGGTSLIQQAGAPTVETAWNTGGGGVSLWEQEPSYQEAVQSSGFRETPDVSMDAALIFGGVAVYDSYDDFQLNGGDPWYEVGGTSLSCPMWGGLIAIANQGRVAAGGETLDSYGTIPSQQTLDALYSAPSYDFNDIVDGNNEGHAAVPGYDMATGLGSPRANLLLPDLAAYDLTSQPVVTGQPTPNLRAAITVQPPSTVDPGETFGLAASIQSEFGNTSDYNTDVGFDGTATLYQVVSGTPTKIGTGSVVNGVAVFDGVTLANGQSAQYDVAIGVNGQTFTTALSNMVTASAKAGTETLTPAPSDASLAAALSQAAKDSASNITIKLESGIYALNLGGEAALPLVIQDVSTTVPLKTITIVGAGQSSTIIEPSQQQGWGSSIFEIVGSNGDEVAVTIEGVTIEGGEATSGGKVSSQAALGGGVLVDGGTLALEQVALVHDQAVGKDGAVGAAGARKRQGATGGTGQVARGGGLYVASGTVKMVGVTLEDDIAWGGQGGTGGVGGTDGGSGGVGGRGGSATGGGVYIGGGVVTGSNNVLSSDAAIGGWGGYGGHGGLGGTELGLGGGGRGGAAGSSFGGGLYVGGGAVTLTATPISHDAAYGGRGGTGGYGGFSHEITYTTTTSFPFTSYPFFIGRGGSAGAPGDAAGGGVYIAGGSLTLGVAQGPVTNLAYDRAQGGYFGSTGDARISRYFLHFAASAGHPARPIIPFPYGPVNGPGSDNGASAPAPGAHPIGQPQSTNSAGTSGTFPVGRADGGGLYVAGGSVTLFSQNVSNDLANSGGGVYVSAGGSVVASGLTMKNDAAEIGGAILNDGTVAISKGVLAGNKAALLVDNFSNAFGTFVGARGSTGGAIANYGHLGLAHASVSDNSARYGGGIFSRSGAVVGSHLNVNDNKAITRGGGIYSIRGALTLDGHGGATIDGNTVSATGSSLSVAVGSGGGIDIKSGKATITGMVISGDEARAGGGIYISAGTATISGTNFEDNIAHQYAGAIYDLGTVKITGGTISGNSAHFNGGAVDNFDSLSITGATISANTAGTNGGAIDSVAALTLTGDTISGNSAGSLGGGVDNGGTLVAKNTTITLNNAQDGGGLFAVGSVTLTQTDQVTQNIAVVSGGGIDEGSGGQVKATGLLVSGNVAQQGSGGGIYDKRGSLSILGGEISSNNAPANKPNDTLGWGGGIYDSGGKVTLSGTPLEKNTSVYGAGLYVTSGSVSLTNETIDHDTATKAGGGIWNLGTLTLTTSNLTLNVAQQQGGGGLENSGKLTITNSNFSLNSAAAGTGGDLDNAATGTASIAQSSLASGSAGSGGDAANAGSLTIETSTLSYGTASTAGGGLANLGSGSVRMANATIADNESLGNGGGIDSQGTLTIVNATIADNTVGAAGGGIDVQAGTTSLVNTIVYQDAGGAGSEIAGTVATSSAYNLIGTGGSGGLTDGVNGNQVGVTSSNVLGTLTYNGGLTPTIELLAGSPAIDAGSNALAVDPVTGKPLTTDQRGALRGGTGDGLNAGSRVDVGAFEASSSYMVTSTADSLTIAGTLRSALDWAGGSSNYNAANIADPAPNTVVFDLSGTFAIPQTITLNSALPSLTSKLDNLLGGPIPIEIQGPGGNIVTISGGGKLQVFSVPSGSQAILQGITVTGGTAVQGGGVANAGTLTLNNTILMGNTAGSGGGVYSNGTLKVDGGTLEDNSAGSGGGLYADTGAAVSISGASFQDNTAVSGGGIYTDSGTLTIVDSQVTENTATLGGGGLADLAQIGSAITGGTFSGNTATTGGGLEIMGAGATITGTILSGNTAITGGAGFGGAIAFLSGAGTLDASALTLSNNMATSGGAIYNAGTLDLTASTLGANSAQSVGGGIDNAGTLTVSATTLSGNSATSGGGIDSGGTLTLVGSTFSGNSAATGGGVADTDGLGDTITNSTFAGNTATSGGGVYSNLSTLTLLNTTIAYNAVGSSGAGAGLDVAGGSVGLYNTIVDLNSGTGTTDVAGPWTGSNNLITVPNPGLASALAGNGGPTQTIALKAGSPAIDAGANAITGLQVPTTDQRGAVRGGPGGGLNAGANVDIGAYEATSEYMVTTAADTKDLGTFRTAVGWANVSTNANPANSLNPAPNTVEFDAAGSFSTPQTITLSSAAGMGTLVLSNKSTAEAIVSPGAGVVTLSGGNAVGVLQVNSGVSASLANLAITGGSAAAGAGINNAGNLTVTGGSVSSNSATGSGGGINNTGTLSLSATSVEGNTATGSGGGIDNTGTLTLAAGTTIGGNSAAVNGGGIADPGHLTLNIVTISGNTATTGGGIVVGGSLTDTGSAFTGNAATTGGGLEIQKGGTASLTGSTVAGNTAGSSGVTGSGGGIDNAGTLTLLDATIGRATVGQQTVPGNTATGAGGGIDNESGGTLTVSYSAVTDNVAGGKGGGGIDNSGAATVTIATLSANTAATAGGGLSNELGGTLILSDDTLDGNTATTGGGGLANVGTSTVTNATIASNTGGRGGGVYDTGVLTINNATIAYNSVGAGGSAGGLDAVSGSTFLYNTIVAQNTSGVGSASDAAGSLSPVSAYNLFGTGGSGGLTTFNSNLVNVKNPGLGPLAPLTGPTSNGGPTQTIALLPGSPAIDAGGASIPNDTVPTVDQRGALRGPAGLDAGSSPDIGAYEASSSYLVTTTADSTTMGTLRSAIAWANVSTNSNPMNLAPKTAAANTAVFDTSGAFATPQTITLSAALGPIVLTNPSTTGESIDGTASNGLTISGGGTGPLFTVAPGSTATLTGLTLSGGYSALSGGAISDSGNLTISYSSLTGNSAGIGGGAIDDLGTLDVLYSTISGNSAGDYGGAVDVEPAGTLNATNSTFASNAAAQGGGIYSTGTFTSINATVAYNTTSDPISGGGLDAAGGVSTLYNTIVASNSDTAGGTTPDDIAGLVSPQGSSNLIGSGGSGGLIGGVNGNIVLAAGQDPGLAAGLAANGGPTQTIALTPTSPAIGAGATIADDQTIVDDQRGALRGTTTIDIGAFEYSSNYLVTNALDSTVPGTLRSAIAWADSDTGAVTTVPLTITFDTQNGFVNPQVINLSLGTMALTNTSRPIEIIGGANSSIVTINGNGTSGVFSVAPGVTLQLSDLTIENGVASSGAGVDNQGTLQLNDVTFAGNATPAGGSGAAIDNDGPAAVLSVTNSAFVGNTGSYYGGAIYNDDGTATIDNSSFVNNTTAYGLGGAIDNFGGTLTVTGGTFTGNSAFQGGAIYNRYDATNALPATASINAVTISGNTAYQGGALFNEGTVQAGGSTTDAVMTVADSTLANNAAFQGGAASNNYGSTLNLIDDTLAFNTAQQYGGAIDSVSTLSIVADTIAYNVAAPGGTGGGIDIYGGTASLYDSIVALNTIGTGTSAADNDIAGQVASSSSYNMVISGGLVNGVNHNIVVPLTGDPGLAPSLANNGGPTETIALEYNSPAIGAGGATIPGVGIPQFDQRGIARPATGYDIGAFQGNLPAPPTTTTTTTTTTPSAAPAPDLVAAAATSVTAPSTVSNSLAPVITGSAPFSGRNLSSKGHHKAKAKAGHATSGDHQSARAASSERRTVKVRIVKHKHG